MSENFRLPNALVPAAVLLFALLPHAGWADDEKVAAVLKAHARAFIVDEEGLHGEGAGWLIEQAGAAQFTLIGESHHNVETPLLTRGLLAALRDSGYSAYVVESGPESTRLLMDKVARGGIEAGIALQQGFPYSLAFLDRHEELEAAAKAVALGYEVWGVDQEFMGSPRLLLNRLGELTTDANEQERIAGMIDREMEALARLMETGDPSGALLLSTPPREFDALAAAFADPDSEGARIVDQLRASATIYRAFAEQRYYDNNASRVDLIKRNFLSRMQQPDGTLSNRRAFIKMGSVHSGRGRTPMHVYDIGNFAAELAFAQGNDSLHVLVLATGSVQPDGEFASWHESASHLVPAFELVPDDNAMVFDLRPLRPLLTQRTGKTPEQEKLQETALRYDALVVFPRFHPASPIVGVPGE